MATELMIIMALVLANGFLSMSEMAIVSARRARLRDLTEGGSRRARSALSLAEDPDRFLAAVQIGITLIGVVSGAYAGVTVGEALGRALSASPQLAPYSEGLGVGTVVVGITILSLVFGELVPKRLGLAHAERLALALAPLLTTMSRLATPLTWILTLATSALTRAFGLGGAEGLSVTDSEIGQLARDGAREGALAAAEAEMIQGVLQLDTRRLDRLMTPRHEVVWLSLQDTPAEVVQKVSDHSFSRFPVCGSSPDEVVGVAKARDILAAQANDGGFDLARLTRPALILPESVVALQALDGFRQAHSHLAVVVDEYGSVQGIATVNDIVQAVVGEALGPERALAPDLTERPDGTLLVDGTMAVDEFLSHVESAGDVSIPANVHTVGGLVMCHLQRVPEAGDRFCWGALRFEVVDMDGNRVDKVLVSPAPNTSAAEPDGPSARNGSTRERDE